ncbi:Hypothetical protein I595_2611 [Croceitalea dokdonensis DOKDO 023]|uniref:Putative auto-transporter adhesin head GIN domain-containing protein n=1 Tax=Croceitalea dokdonensis DOKDO 023 TaxID=1300341 RepID=A0A0P7AYA4_9FLAO|nr:DUF2807 domain-containing protein [Croceitalea dokdonensis]KPM31344.1 Hypothetical protein I595_2611 [Croceitalea dokdonensis DOKDO 023]
MKKICICVCLCFAVFGYSQRKPKIKGNRAVTEEQDVLPAFNAIALNDDIDVRLRKANTEGYQIVADDNLIDILKFEVLDSTLVISSYYTVTSKKKFEITIDFVEIEQIVQNSGSIETEDFLGMDSFYLQLSGDAKFKARTKAFITTLDLEEKSFADLNMDTDSLQVKLNGRSDLKLYAVSGASNFSITGSGTADVQGSTEDLNGSFFEKARFKAEEFQAKNVGITIEDDADARVFATDTLYLESSGKGQTYFYGDAKIIVERFLNESQLIKKEN